MDDGSRTLLPERFIEEMQENGVNRDLVRQYNSLSRLKKDMVNRKIKKYERRMKHGKLTGKIPSENP